MAANGAGVVLDASATPLRLTWYDRTHADFQDDGTRGEMDLHKIWACMGRAGTNGVTRAGFVELGDPYTGAPPAFIETCAGGVLSGASAWNTNAAYNPLGGLTAGDWCAFGCLSSARGLALHLDTPHLGAQPSFQLEQLTTLSGGNYIAGAWQNITANITATPDFTQANGKRVQRLEWEPHFTLNALRPGDAVGGVLLAPYYIFRLRLMATIAGGPAANTNYRDFLYGHLKHWYSHYDLKYGDDTAGNNDSSFYDDGWFTVRFRDGFGWKTDTTRTGTFQLGALNTASKRPVPKAPWASYSSLGPQMRNAKLYGGFLAGRQRYTGEFLPTSIVSASEMIDCRLFGWSQGTLGGTSALAMSKVDWVRVTPDYADSGVGTLAAYFVSSSGYARDVMVDTQAGRSATWAVLCAENSAVVYGLSFSDDDVAYAQLYLTGSAYKDVYGIQWGGATRRLWGEGTNRERRRLGIWVLAATTGAPIQSIGVRVADSTGRAQASTTVSSAVGFVDFVSALTNTLLTASSHNSVSIHETSDGLAYVPITYDEYLVVEVNAVDMASYNPAYETRTVRLKITRAFNYDNATSGYVVQDWQSHGTDLYVALKAATPAAADESAPMTVDRLPIAVMDEERINTPVRSGRTGRH